MDTPSKHHWWKPLRVSVRGLVALVLVIGACIGWMARSARIQREAVASLVRTNSGVYYDWQRATVGTIRGYRLDATPPWPKWLVDRIGVDHFGHVVEVVFSGADADLANIQLLDRLERLTIDCSATFTEGGLEHLGRLTSLKELDLGNLGVGDAGLRHLRGLTALRSLGLREARVTGAGLQHIQGMTELEEIYLGRSEVGDDGLIYIGRVTGLQVLHLNTTRITDAGLVALKGLIHLRTLDLAGTKIGDAGIAHLKVLTGLQELGLWKTNVSDIGVEELQHALPKLKIRRPLPRSARWSGLQVLDDRGQAIGPHGLSLTDWEGYIANPAAKFYLLPPSNAAYPVKVVLSANHPRLHFDLPSEARADGPRKELIWQQPEKRTVHMAIFPDRDGQDETHRLRIDFSDARGGAESFSLPIHVTDQDRDRSNAITITVDFSQDRTGFFRDEIKRATVIQAANDWAYFFADMKLQPVAAGAEKTLIWGSDGFKSSTTVTNLREYQGYLLYAYGIRNEPPAINSTKAPPSQPALLNREPDTQMIRSGGEPSPYGEFQVSAGKRKPIRRSGGLEIEIQGNYNTLGWTVILSDGEWWKAANLGDAAADLYSIAHHEIGHALIFNPNNSLVKRGVMLTDERVRAYLGRFPTLNQSDHLDSVIDPASLHGAFGNEYHGRMPRGRWLITKLDLLCARVIGYELRETSAFHQR
jgi:hypothetical protein